MNDTDALSRIEGVLCIWGRQAQSNTNPVAKRDGARVVDYFLDPDIDNWTCYGIPLLWQKPSDKKCFELLTKKPNKWTTRAQHKSTGLKDSTIRSAVSHIRVALWDVLKQQPRYAKMGNTKGRRCIRRTILKRKKTKLGNKYLLSVESDELGFKLKIPAAKVGNI